LEQSVFEVIPYIEVNVDQDEQIESFEEPPPHGSDLML